MVARARSRRRSGSTAERRQPLGTASRLSRRRTGKRCSPSSSNCNGVPRAFDTRAARGVVSAAPDVLSGGSMRRIFPLLALALLVPATAGAAPPAAGWKIPIEVKKLPNGLTVVVSEDHTAPTFGMSTAYRIGFRLEPKGRTGFAHLLEHIIFEETPVTTKGYLT